MRVLICVILAVGGMVSSAAVQNDPSEEALRRACLAEWQPDFDMARYCLEEQLDSQKTWAAVISLNDGAKEIAMLDGCASDWPADYTMRVYCYREQYRGAKAVTSLLAGAAGDKMKLQAFRQCEAEWRSDYQMQAYCMTHQAKALTALRN